MNEPTRILHVFGSLNRGGAETMIMNLYRNIDRSKIQFDFIVHTKEKCDYDDEIHSLGGKIYRIPKYKGKNHIEYKRAWRAFFQEHKEYKIIHGHVRSTASIYLKIAKKNGLTTIAHSHSISSGTGIVAIIKDIMQLNIRYTADYLFACSELAGKWLFGKKALKSEKFFIINNAIDAKKFIFNEDIRNKKRKELKIEKKFVIGNVGRFIETKNHNFLIDIFKEIHNKMENSLLLLVGEGELKESIEKKVIDLGLKDSVIFMGSRNDIHEILQAMDVFVFPSLYEGLGMVAIESQATGLYTIISDKFPEEVFITDVIEEISLKKPISYWADKIIKHNDYERINTFEYIKSKGYDINKTSKWLEKFYIKINFMLGES